MSKPVILGCLSLAVSACGAVSHQSKMDPEFQAPTELQVEILSVTDDTGENFGFDAEKKLTEELTKDLEEAGLLWDGESPRLGLNVQIVDYEKGNAFKRWLWPGYGSTILRIECEVVHDGKFVGDIDALRTVSWGGGYSIGAWSTIFGQLGDDIVHELEEIIPDEIE